MNLNEPPMRTPDTALVTLVFAATFFLFQWSQATENYVELGRNLVDQKCSRCHATGTRDSGTHPSAPDFRNLSENYPVEFLAEALAEGIMTGHPDMPTFEFKAAEIEQIIQYLQSIQSK